jgi:hypothetical protein
MCAYPLDFALARGTDFVPTEQGDPNPPTRGDRYLVRSETVLVRLERLSALPHDAIPQALSLDLLHEIL